MANLPTSPNFDSNNIRIMVPYSALLFFARLGYMIRLLGGELDTLGVVIVIVTLPLTAAALAIAVTLCYKLSIHTRTRREEDWYHLTWFQAGWPGDGGGGGHMYNQNLNLIGNSPLDVKERTLRVQITTHEFVPNNPAALQELR
ncbi:hypothetical protein EPUS_04497 [Endocarpon pusillum Z07020]|uniref:Uncharacterized protein n=1 Tax=Endocarpon pusillum (strain Z07020 / HMAS-L-300199) TaxID=1263415 RepID=U1HFG7_ENDPU|nr:uncharacterized protein EPUS_04497 [Endocarpon pusillum Z07020]ERF68845.1 hypothetical protein EPUS_04497 [Endocarpon pusillum Z07020]